MELANSTLAILAALSAVRTDLSGLKAEVRGLIKDVMEEERGIIRQEMVELEKLRAQTREGLDLLTEMRENLLEILYSTVWRPCLLLIAKDFFKFRSGQN